MYIPTPKPIVFIEDEKGCFTVTSIKPNKDGYIKVTRNKKTVLLHRLIYEECFGIISENKVVRHKCDNRRCINPEHLELGSNLDNIRDRVERNRSAIGSKNGASKLTENQVLEIREDTIHSVKELAIMYEVSEITIYRVKRGQKWSHVGGNIRDKITVNGNAKLTEEDIRYIRHCKDYTQRKLAEMFNVSIGCIEDIKRGISWKHIK